MATPTNSLGEELMDETGKVITRRLCPLKNTPTGHFTAVRPQLEADIAEARPPDEEPDVTGYI